MALGISAAWWQPRCWSIACPPATGGIMALSTSTGVCERRTVSTQLASIALVVAAVVETRRSVEVYLAGMRDVSSSNCGRQ